MKHIDLNGDLVMVTGGAGAIGSAIAMESAQAVEQLGPFHGLVTAAEELASRDIRVNNVAPGWVNGGFTHQALAVSDHPDQLRDRAKQLHALGRMTKPTDVANAVVWLPTDQESFVTGSMLLVDGGFMIQHKS